MLLSLLNKKSILLMSTFFVLNIIKAQEMLFSKTSVSDVGLSCKEVIVNDSIYTVILIDSKCKNIASGYVFQSKLIDKNLSKKTSKNTSNDNNDYTNKTSFLKIKGDVSYEYFRSQRVDTFTSYNLIEQHTVRANLQLLIKDKYPINLNFSTGQSSNNFFRKYFDLGFQWNKNQFQEIRKIGILEKFKKENLSINSIKNLTKDITYNDSKIKNLLDELKDPAILQRIIKEREKKILNRKIHASLNTTSIDKKPSSSQDSLSKGSATHKSASDSIKNKNNIAVVVSKDSSKNNGIDSLKTPTEKWLNDKEVYLHNLQDKQKTLTKYRDSLTNAYNEEENSIVNSFNNKEKWKKHIEKYGDLSKDNKKFSFQDVKSLGIGKTSVDFSEFTIRNKSITGLVVEYNPRTYISIAGGKIDYRFRDFFMPNNFNIPQQEFYIARVGTNQDNTLNFIFSVFSGKGNQFFNNSVTQSRFSGYSILSKLKFSKDSYLELEAAKTTPPNLLYSTTKAPTLLSFNNNSNFAFSWKVHFDFPNIATRVDGSYKTIGELFQSINFLTNNIRQNAWSVKVDNSLLKKTLSISASIRKNDFINTLYSSNYNVNTVFKSISVTYKKRRLPFINIGYYPSVQLMAADSNKIFQNICYLFNASSGYTFRNKHSIYSALLNYNSVINQSSDSIFGRFKRNSISFNQNLIRNALNFENSFAYTYQDALKIYSAELGAGVTIKKLSLSSAVKYNQVVRGQGYWGERFSVGVSLKTFGRIQMNYDKQYIISSNNKLLGADLGKLIWIKSF